MHVDGFVTPVKAAQRIIALYRQHSATRCVETWAEGLDPGERTSVPRAVASTEGKAVVSSWMDVPDKATSVAAHGAVWSDTSLQDMMEIDLFDGTAMIFGGPETTLDMQ